MPSIYKDEYARAKPKIDAHMKRGRFFRAQPAAMVFVVGDRRIPLSLESAQYLLYNISLYAQVKGIGTQNLVGNQMFFNRSRELRGELRLKGKERIFAAAALDYPAVEFVNKVTGRTIPIQWNGGGE